MGGLEEEEEEEMGEYCSFSPFSTETVSGAAPQQQREKSMMNN